MNLIFSPYGAFEKKIQYNIMFERIVVVILGQLLSPICQKSIIKNSFQFNFKFDLQIMEDYNVGNEKNSFEIKFERYSLLSVKQFFFSGQQLLEKFLSTSLDSIESSRDGIH